MMHDHDRVTRRSDRRLAVLLLAAAAVAPFSLACADPAADDLAERAEVAAPVEPPAETGDAMCVDTERSIVRWRGTEVGGGGHEGIVRIASGRITLRDSTVTAGSFAVDMRTIEVTDIPEHETVARRRLRNHLEHEEFFAVERFPTARFVITDVERGDHGVFTVSGNLAIRDSVHNVTFEADAPVLSRDDLWATARFSFDRQLWGVAYDGTISRITDDLVHDDIQLEITLVARSAADGATACPDAGMNPVSATMLGTSRLEPDHLRQQFRQPAADPHARATDSCRCCLRAACSRAVC